MRFKKFSEDEGELLIATRMNNMEKNYRWKRKKKGAKKGVLKRGGYEKGSVYRVCLNVRKMTRGQSRKPGPPPRTHRTAVL